MIRSRAVAVAAALASVASLGACSLDLKNPNSPTQDEVTKNVDAVIGLATGLQGRFAQSYGNFAYMAGLVTDEFSATSAALISISDAEQGAVPSGTAIADNVFNSVYRTVRTADELLAGMRDGSIVNRSRRPYKPAAIRSAASKVSVAQPNRTEASYALRSDDSLWKP